jgi:signal transduction histidine kinase/tetratricopeptide (TPR) repeat protein
MYQFDLFFKRFFVLSTLIFCFFFTPNSIAQDQRKIDSLKGKLQSASNGEKFELLINLFTEFIETDNIKANEYAQHALVVAMSTNDSLKMARSYRAIGYALTSIGKNNEGIEAYLKGLKIAEQKNYRELQKYLLNNLALVYTFTSNFDKALDYHFKSLIIREEDGIQDQIGITYNNIGLVYYKIKDFEKALEYYQRSFAIKQEIKDYYDLDRLYINISLCLIELKNYKQAIANVNEAFLLCKQECSDRVKLEGTFTLAKANFYLGNYVLAGDQYLEAKQLALKLEDKGFIAESIRGLSKIQAIKGDYTAALNNLLEAENILANSRLDDELIRVYKEIADTYRGLEDYQQTSVYQNKYISLKDSVYSDRLIRNLARVQTDFEERENLATIAAKDQLILIKEDSLQKQRRFNYAIAVIAMLSIALALVLYRSGVIKQKVNLELQKAKLIIEEQNIELNKSRDRLQAEVDEQTEELQITNKILEDVNKELDNFIYKISHDIRGPLATLRGLCVVAISDVKDQKSLDYLNKLGVTADKLNYILSRLMTINYVNNAPLNLELIDLKLFLNELIPKWTEELSAKKIELKINFMDDHVLCLDVEMTRVILENLIENSIKFSKDAERYKPFIEVKLSRFKDRALLHVIDNGIGLTSSDEEKVFQIFSRASEKSQSGGVGLYLTKIATQKMKGFVNYRTTSDGFTEFIVTLPYLKELPKEQE